MEPLKICFIGNPNCGKTTVFNAIAKQRRNVGNYPGVTVEATSSVIKLAGRDAVVVDLPGAYSLSAHTDDERVTRDYLMNQKPDLVVNVLDSVNLERNLYLTVQLMELGCRVVLVLNMADELEASGREINTKELSELLGSPVIMTVANKGDGIDRLYDGLVDQAQKVPSEVHVDYGSAVMDEVEVLETQVSDVFGNEFPSRWAAIKLLEYDDYILDKVKEKKEAGKKFLDEVDRRRAHLKKHFHDAPEIVLAERRYGFVSGLCAQVLTISLLDRQEASDKADKIILNKFFALPIFVCVMWAVFAFAFRASEPLVRIVEQLLAGFSDFISGFLVSDLLRSFVVDGLIGGVGAVVAFFPLIFCMFLAIAVVEDSGYMARAAFVMDRWLVKVGLHGKSFLPLMISTNGCGALGIYAARTLDDKRDRLITMLIAPFMICGAKLPVVALLIATCVPLGGRVVAMFSVYLFTIAVAMLSALFLRKTVFQGETGHFVLELPPYRMPTASGVFLKTWERSWMYLKKAGTVIVLAAVIVWAAFSFPRLPQDRVSALSGQALAQAQVEHSVAGKIARMAEPVLYPIGLDWRSGSALAAGIFAKEMIVSTFSTLYHMEDTTSNASALSRYFHQDPFWTLPRAVSFLVFSLLYCPCCVSIAVFFKETDKKRWTLLFIAGSTAVAYLFAFVVYHLASFFV